jgi:hypothetical protein
MPDSGNSTFIEWSLGILATIGMAVTRFFNTKIDKKVSREVFEEFKRGNDMSHSQTHSTLKDIKDGQNKLFDKLDGKQDKR